MSLVLKDMRYQFQMVILPILAIAWKPATIGSLSLEPTDMKAIADKPALLGAKSLSYWRIAASSQHTVGLPMI